MKSFLSVFVRSAVIRLCVVLQGVIIVSSGLGEQPRPNVVIILADDLGYGDVGFNGCPDFPTPNIDALAAAGVLCTNGYVTHPICSPSRAGLLFLAMGPCCTFIKLNCIIPDAWGTNRTAARGGLLNPLWAPGSSACTHPRA